MCGIAGVYDLAGASDAATLRSRVTAMTDALRHRGPDGDGLWQEGGVALGHRRLAIIDLTPAGAQPMQSVDGRYVITYNGEVFNFRAVAQELIAAGRPPRGGSDTSVLLEACALWGVEKAIGKFIGMFAFALYDRETRSLTLARDRLGIKPLYWARAGRTILFGSELKALRTWPGFDTSLDAGALTAYFRYAYVPQPASIYQSAHKLPPGHVLTIAADGGQTLRCYWDLRAIARDGQRNVDLASGDAELESLLRDAVAQRLVADVPLGAFLSGGIDSSLVAALMQVQSRRPVKTFSIGFREGAYDESAAARAVARHLGTEHTELTATDADARALVDELPHWYDEPFADSSQIPTLLLSRLTRQHVTVALSGDGGDEVFGGYNRYTWLPRLWQSGGRLPGGVRRFVGGALGAVSPAIWDQLAGMVPAHRRPRQFGDKLHKAGQVFASRDLDAAYGAMLSQWPEPAVLTHGGEMLTVIDDRSINADLPDPVARMQALDMLTYLPDDILTKVDRASMAASLEARVPLLDHRVVEHAWRLPRAHLFEQGVSKAPLRRILYKHVPRALVDRPKMGFAVPIDAWLRGPLRDWAEALLDPVALGRDGLLDPAPVRAAWAEHLSGRFNRQHALWTVLMFQAWRTAA